MRDNHSGEEVLNVVHEKSSAALEASFLARGISPANILGREEVECYDDQTCRESLSYLNNIFPAFV